MDSAKIDGTAVQSISLNDSLPPLCVGTGQYHNLLSYRLKQFQRKY